MLIDHFTFSAHWTERQKGKLIIEHYIILSNSASCDEVFAVCILFIMRLIRNMTVKDFDIFK